jgi:hypothetical protein
MSARGSCTEFRRKVHLRTQINRQWCAICEKYLKRVVSGPIDHCYAVERTPYVIQYILFSLNLRIRLCGEFLS